MKTGQLSCMVPVRFTVKGEDTNLIHNSLFPVATKTEYDSTTRNIVWEGRLDAYSITITQQHHQADIEEQHITIEKNPNATPDPSLIVTFSKKEIAKAINNYLNESFA